VSAEEFAFDVNLTGDGPAFVEAHPAFDDQPAYRRRVEVVLHVSGGDDRLFRPYEDDPGWPSPLRIWQRDLLRGTGRILEDGVELGWDDPRRRRIVDRLLGSTPMPAPIDPTAAEWAVRPYIPELMNYGTVPGFVGPKGWGKTRWLDGLVPALVIPGYRAFGRFGPVEVSEEGRARDVWLLNAETHLGVVHADLLRAGLTFGYRDGVPCYFYDPEGRGRPLDGHGVLIVEHLVATSAIGFDLTDESKFDYWATRLTEYVAHRVPPLTVVADGVTAMLGNNTSKYGAFTSRFKALLKEAGIPNGLGTLHSPMGVHTNTPMQGVESMGEWDGLWIASSPAFPVRAGDRRFLETSPRHGDPVLPQHEVVVGADDQLLMVPVRPGTVGSSGSEDGDPSAEREQALLDRLQALGEAWTKQVCGDGDEYAPDRAALGRLLAAGRVESEVVQQGRSRGTRWRRV
jgi:hypothetical protein